jgi:hypothetical protein
MRQPTSDSPGLPGRDPAEGRPDMDLPGADRAEPASERRPGQGPDPGDAPQPDREPPDSPGADLPERLGERVSNGPGPGIATGEPDLVPDVEVPEETM